MSAPILATKLYIPPPRSKIVVRSRLIKRLNEGPRKLTLISAPAGFGKTTLVSEWVEDNERPTAWLSLDEGDNDLTRFLTYLVTALQTLSKGKKTIFGEVVLSILQSPQQPSTESILTSLINEINAIPDPFIFVLDDYQVIDSSPIDNALTFLVDHLPAQMHLVIATREDPHLPLARLRARGELTELRVADLRFTPTEAAEFLNRMMGLNLCDEDVAALEVRTEGWIAGLQLAALSMQGHASRDPADFIKSFTGSHHFVLDYLMEEVLGQQPESIQTFLLHTSILNRMCGSLCDELLPDASVSGQETLEHLEHANLFVIPLDNERRWYRYHHLFAELLRQRLQQQQPESVTELHIRASEWHEKNGFLVEAFQHAAAANDIERAERLIERKEMPLHFRSVSKVVLDWLASLPSTVLNARPLLWIRSATLALMTGQTTGLEEKLLAAERVLQNAEPDAKIRNLIGQIACARATLALTRYEPDVMLTQARRALEYLNPDNLAFGFTANWALASASILRGDRATATQASKEGISISQKSGDIFSTILATTNLGRVQESENQLYLAAETYRSILPLFGDHPQPNAAEVHLGLAHICYEWNDLESAEQHGKLGLQLARQYSREIDRFIISEMFLSRLKLAQGDVDGAATMLDQIEQSARQKNFILRLPEIAAEQVLVLLRQGNLGTAAELAQKYELPISQARVLLAQGNPSAALAMLEPLRQQMEVKNWQDELLKVIVLQTVALHADCEKDKAVQLLGDALKLAEPGGFIRIFVDEGEPMAQLLSEAGTLGVMPDYIGKLLAAFEDETMDERRMTESSPSSSVEPLSQRELEVLKLIAQGLSNQAICERLFLALDTVKGHNRRIFDKLHVQRRTEAVARAHELGLL
jgi:LuxR family maltose regulon positive regulatory protein